MPMYQEEESKPVEDKKGDEMQQLKQNSPSKAQAIHDASEVVSSIIVSHQRPAFVVDQQPTSSAISHESINQSNV